MKAFWRTQKMWILGVAAVLLLLIGWLAIRYLLPRPVIGDTAEVQLVTVEYWDKPVELNERAEEKILEILSELSCARADYFTGFFLPEDRVLKIRVDLDGGGVIELYLGEDSVIQTHGNLRKGYYRLKNPREAEERLTAIILPLLPEAEAST